MMIMTALVLSAFLSVSHSTANANPNSLIQLDGKGFIRDRTNGDFYESIVCVMFNSVTIGLGVSVRKGAVLIYHQNPSNIHELEILFKYNDEKIIAGKIFDRRNVLVMSLWFETNSELEGETIPTSDFYCYTINSDTPTIMYGWNAELLPDAENESTCNEVPEITKRNGVIGWSDQSFVYVYDNENGSTEKIGDLLFIESYFVGFLVETRNSEHITKYSEVTNIEGIIQSLAYYPYY